jgi:NitT/TauT family transport system substrate-binding protein
MKNKAAIVGIMICCWASLMGRASAEQTVKVGYLRLVMSLPTFVAVENGLFDRQGVKVELVPFQSGTAIIDALVAGRIHADCGSATSGHWFAEQNVPGRFRIFLVYGPDSMDGHTFVAVVHKQSPIKDFKGLKGKKVGHFPGATSRALARAVIRTQLDPEAVTMVEVPPPNMVPALAAGQIDVFFTPEPLGMLAVSKGVGKYLRKNFVTVTLGLKKGYPGGAFSFSAKFLEKHSDVATRFKAAMESAVDSIGRNEKQARSYIQKYTGLPQSVAERIPFDKWIKIKDLNKEAGQVYFDILFKEGAYKKRLDTTKLYYQ